MLVFNKINLVQVATGHSIEGRYTKFKRVHPKLYPLLGLTLASEKAREAPNNYRILFKMQKNIYFNTKTKQLKKNK